MQEGRENMENQGSNAASVRLILPFPPSVNHVWGRKKSGGVYLVKAARLYRLAVKSIVAAAGLQGLPLEGRLIVALDLYPPSRHRRDADNYCKAPLDALTKAGVWLDDSQVIRPRPEIHEVVPGGRLVVTITTVRHAEAA